MRLLERLRTRARALKADSISLYLAVRDPRTPWYARLFVAAIVAYALSPIDLIPDFIPVLGMLDEIVLLPFAIAIAIRMIPERVMEEARRDAAARSARAPRSWFGAAVILIVWVAVIAWSTWFAIRLLTAAGGES